MRGFDPDEVTAFLDMISLEYENLIRENAILNEKVGNLDSQLKKYRDIENTLRETLLSAQRAREDTIKTAKKQAEVIIREAEVKAAALMEEGRNALTKLRNAFTELKVHKDTYLTKIKALTKAQLEVFEQYAFSEEEKLGSVEPILAEEKPETTETQKQAVKKLDFDAPLSRETFFPEEPEKSDEN